MYLSDSFYDRYRAVSDFLLLCKVHEERCTPVPVLRVVHTLL